MSSKYEKKNRTKQKSRKKRYSHRKIRSNRVYYIHEIAELFGITKGTVRKWVKQGLKFVDRGKYGFLIRGEDLIHFLKEQQSRRRVKLFENEFYCSKCRRGRTSKGGKVTLLNSGRRVAKSANSVQIKGICSHCGTTIRKFSSTQQIKAWIEDGTIKMRNFERLMISTNNHIKATFVAKGDKS